MTFISFIFSSLFSFFCWFFDKGLTSVSYYMYKDLLIIYKLIFSFIMPAEIYCSNWYLCNSATNTSKKPNLIYMKAIADEILFLAEHAKKEWIKIILKTTWKNFTQKNLKYLNHVLFANNKSKIFYLINTKNMNAKKNQSNVPFAVF